MNLTPGSHTLLSMHRRRRKHNNGYASVNRKKLLINSAQQPDNKNIQRTINYENLKLMRTNH